MTKKILIIEDEKVLLDILKKKVVKEGFEVIVATDGEDGFEKAKSQKPDLIMLDMLLPKMDGYEVLESLKENNIKTPVIIISNSGQPVDIDKAIKLGACDYLVKAELDPNEIMEKIRRCLSNQPINTCPVGAKKILIIEDDEFLRQLCAKKISQMKFCVSVAVNGMEGLEKINEEKPDLILSDIIMPVMEGFEVLKKVRASKDKKIANTPIIMLSNLGQESDVKKAKELGANDYLIKAHFTTDEIVNKIKKYLD